MKKYSRQPVLLFAALTAVFVLIVLGTVATVFAYRHFNERESGQRQFAIELNQIDDDQLTPEKGVIIHDVSPDSPAATVGLNSGDIILMVNGIDVDDPSELIRAINEHEAGDSIILTVQTDDEVKDIAVELASAGPYLGVELGGNESMLSGKGLLPGQHSDIFPDFGDLDEILPHLGDLEEFPMHPPGEFAHPGEMPEFPEGFHDQFRDGFPVNPDEFQDQVVIWSVEPGSPADAAGLQAGDIITKINDELVSGRDEIVDVISSLSPEEVLELEIIRADVVLNVHAALGSHPEDEGRGYLGIYLAPGFRFQHQEFGFDNQSG